MKIYVSVICNGFGRHWENDMVLPTRSGIAYMCRSNVQLEMPFDLDNLLHFLCPLYPTEGYRGLRLSQDTLSERRDTP